MTDELDAIREENTELRERVEDLESEIDELDSELNNYECPICKELQADVDELNSEIYALEDKLEVIENLTEEAMKLVTAWTTYRLYSNLNPRHPDIKEIERCVEAIIQLSAK